MPVGGFAGGPIRLLAPIRHSVTASAAQGTALSSNVHGLIIRAICSGGALVYVGTTSAVTTATGYPLVDGEVLTLEIANANALYFISSTGTQAVSIFPFYRA